MWCGKIKKRTQNPTEKYLIVEIKDKPKQLETLIYNTLMQYDIIKSRDEQTCKQI